MTETSIENPEGAVLPKFNIISPMPNTPLEKEEPP